MKRHSSFTLRVVAENLRRHRGLMALLLLVVAAVVALSLIPPQLLRRIIDDHLTKKVYAGIPRLAAAYLGTVVLIGLCDFLKGGVLTIFGQKIVRDLRAEMAKKLTRISTTYFSKNTAGYTANRFISDVDNVSSLFADGIVSMVIDSFKILGILVSVFLFSTRLGGVVLCLVPVVYGFTRAFQKRLLRAQLQNLEQLGRVNDHIAETLKNSLMIKQYSREAYLEKRYTARLADNFTTINRVNLYDACYSPIIMVLRTVVIALIVLLSAKQLGWLGISVGMVAASIELVINLFSPIESLGMELQNIQKGIGGIRRIDAFFREPEDAEKDLSIRAEDLLRPGGGGLVFDHLSFSYDGDSPVLEDLSFTIEPDTSVTVAGRTGVGKTTLFRLILGLLKPTAGCVTFSGVDVFQIPGREKRKLFGYVEQSFSCIEGTAAEQISLRDPAITPDMVERALRFVGLHETISALPQGYDTPITGSGGFSQGQKQLLSIARAIVADPAVLLLDEVTANLDSVTEARVVEVLRRAGQGRTILSISHRLTAMIHCDRMVLLENGRIRASGAPEELLERDPWFRAQVGLEKNAWGA